MWMMRSQLDKNSRRKMRDGGLGGNWGLNYRRICVGKCDDGG